MRTTVLYHKNCNDGLIAALNFYALFMERNELDLVTFLPVQYGEELPPAELIKDRIVYVLDFSYSAEQMTELDKIAGHLTVLDHHESAIKNLFTGDRWLTNEANRVENEEEGIYMLSSVKSLISVNKQMSGATLAHRYLIGRVRDVRVINTLKYLSIHAADRDNWVFEYADTKAVYEYVRTLGNDLQIVYEALFGEGRALSCLKEKVKQAQVRVDMRNELAGNYARLAKPIEFMGYTVPAVNVPSDFASVVGDILDKDAPFAVMYTVTNEKILLSLRSDKITGVNVQEIASKLGGGGHVNAAGGSITHAQLSDLLQGKIQ